MPDTPLSAAGTLFYSVSSAVGSLSNELSSYAASALGSPPTAVEPRSAPGARAQFPLDEDVESPVWSDAHPPSRADDSPQTAPPRASAPPQRSDTKRRLGFDAAPPAPGTEAAQP